MRPPAAGSKPIMAEIVVVLPMPLRPSSATISPSPTVKVTLSARARGTVGGLERLDLQQFTSLHLFAERGGHDLRIGADFIGQAGDEETAADQDGDAIG